LGRCCPARGPLAELDVGLYRRRRAVARTVWKKPPGPFPAARGAAKEQPGGVPKNATPAAREKEHPLSGTGHRPRGQAVLPGRPARALHSVHARRGGRLLRSRDVDRRRRLIVLCRPTAVQDGAKGPVIPSRPYDCPCILRATRATRSLADITCFVDTPCDSTSGDHHGGQPNGFATFLSFWPAGPFGLVVPAHTRRAG
jgi:hypothetical protein